MKNRIIKYIVLLTSIFSLASHAQMKERGLTRNGNDFVKDSLFVMAEAEYLKSLDIHDFDTNRFNMAFAMLGQEKFDEAIEEWESVEKTSDNKILKSYCAYNSGGALVMQKKNDEAIEKFKQALRYFPKNDLARHNYWLLKVVKEQNPQQDQKQENQDQDKQDGDNKDQENQDQNSDQNNSDQDSKDGEKGEDSQDEKSEEDSKENESEEEKNKDGEPEEESEDESEDEKNKDSESKEESEDEKSEDEKNKDGESENEEEGENGMGEEPKEGELSTGDALRLLESLDKEEDKTQEKVKAKLLKGKKGKKSEKDW